ncbi:MAG: C4-dicarboxylate transporter DctA, partial [Opitutaceae bacterium]
MSSAEPIPASAGRSPRVSLYVQVLIGIVLGGLLCYLEPTWGVAMPPFGDAFVNLVKMLIG